jgi:ferredoxin
MPIQEDLQTAIRSVLPDVSCVIGWGPGPDVLQSAPLFMRSDEDVKQFQSGFFAVNNTALFLPELKKEKVAVVVKGCDARSLGQLLAENLIARENIQVIGFPCTGVIDVSKVAAALSDKEAGEAKAVVLEKDELVIRFDNAAIRLKKAAVTADKCARCMYPNALIADIFVGEKQEPIVSKDNYEDLAAFEELPLEERPAFWEKEMSRCIRCYACRNACPICVCRDHCIASSREPEWVSQADGPREKMFFQIIHASHLAGRCTGCGECQRACPVGIPVLLLKRSLSRRVEELFTYKAGIDIEGTPPLLTFQIEEPKIKERAW